VTIILALVEVVSMVIKIKAIFINLLTADMILSYILANLHVFRISVTLQGQCSDASFTPHNFAPCCREIKNYGVNVASTGLTFIISFANVQVFKREQKHTHTAW
jgi:hypothetical protein